MFDFLEVHKLDPGFNWLEIKANDVEHPEPMIVRVVTDQNRKKMCQNFISKYLAKRGVPITIPESQTHLLEEFFEEIAMAKVVVEQDSSSPDLLDLLPTTVFYFKYPERTSFRKSRTTRISMFLEEALEALNKRDFECAISRLNWIHHLDPSNEDAFNWKVVCLRSWKKMAECVHVFESWIEASPDQMEPRLGLGEMWIYLGQHTKARDTFRAILEIEPKNAMALVGLAQALFRMGEDALTELRRAWMVDQRYTVEMVEQQMDFRLPNPPDLRPRSFKSISAHYKLPLRQLLDRASRGVLPCHPALEDGLLRFSDQELDRYYAVLKCVGLVLGSAPTKTVPPEPTQPSLFDEEELLR